MVVFGHDMDLFFFLRSELCSKPLVNAFLDVSPTCTGFFIDTKAIWSCGRTVHFIDMRSFVAIEKEFCLIYDTWYFISYETYEKRRFESMRF